MNGSTSEGGVESRWSIGLSSGNRSWHKHSHQHKHPPFLMPFQQLRHFMQLGHLRSANLSTLALKVASMLLPINSMNIMRGQQNLMPIMCTCSCLYLTHVYWWFGSAKHSAQDGLLQKNCDEALQKEVLELGCNVECTIPWPQYSIDACPTSSKNITKYFRW